MLETLEQPERKKEEVAQEMMKHCLECAIIKSKAVKKSVERKRNNQTT